MRLDLVEHLRGLLQVGDGAALGGWVVSGSAVMAEAMASTDVYDWMAVDMQHSSATLRECENCIRAIEGYGIVPLVRTMERSGDMIDRYLDAGAGGIIFADVRTGIDARTINGTVGYRPEGYRSFSLGRSMHFGESAFAQRYKRTAPLIIMMIESMMGVEALGEILAAKPDAIMIGAYDLSTDYGGPGDFGHRDYQEAVDRIQLECAQGEVALGIHLPYPTADMINDYVTDGYQFVGVGMDTTFATMGSHRAIPVSAGGHTKPEGNAE